MTVLVDASALVAMATNEPDALSLADALRLHNDRLCCATGVWEATLAIARKRTVSTAEARAAVTRLLSDLGIELVSIADAEADAAIRAHARYGKGTSHPAKLNMGDCFAYACAKTNGAKLLYKGNDFIHTDLK